MNKQYDKHFLSRYQQGLCSKQEEDVFLKWIDTFDATIREPWMEEIWEESENSENVILGAEERILGKVIANIHKTPVHKIQHQKIKSIHYPNLNFWQLYPFLRYASIILIVLIPLLVYNSLFSTVPEFTPTQCVEKTTHNGQHLTFVLDDGTEIILNSNSKLSYPEQFTDSSRIVSLSGEAFFHVAKDSKRPFTVITGGVSTSALGTSFNIHYHPTDSISSISLVTGSVKVEINSATDMIKDVFLSPGEQLSYNFIKKTYERNEFDSLAVSGWKEGIIYFKEAELDEIVARLEEWYDVTIELRGRLNEVENSNWTYSGQFKNQSLENVLLGIGYVKKFSFDINQKNVKLIFN
jgi:hypothetical protein